MDTTDKQEQQTNGANPAEAEEVTVEFQGKFKGDLGKECCSSSSSKNYGSTTGGAVYGLGFIGAAVYFISTASGFWMGVLGFLKAIVWPAFLVFELLKDLGM